MSHVVKPLWEDLSRRRAIAPNCKSPYEEPHPSPGHVRRRPGSCSLGVNMTLITPWVVVNEHLTAIGEMNLQAKVSVGWRNSAGWPSG